MMAGQRVDVRSVVRHPDPSQLLHQLREIVDEGVYLHHGVRVGEADVVFDVGAIVGVATAFLAANCGAAVHSSSARSHRAGPTRHRPTRNLGLLGHTEFFFRGRDPILAMAYSPLIDDAPRTPG